MKDDLFDKLLQQKTGSHEAPVPADAWANISKKKKKKRYAAWWFTGVILLAGISIGGYFQMNKRDQAIVNVLKTNEDRKKKDTERNNSIVQKNDNNSIVSNNTTLTPPQKDLSSGIPSVAKDKTYSSDGNQSQAIIAKKSNRAGRSFINIRNSSSTSTDEMAYTNKLSSGTNTGRIKMVISNATVAEGNDQEGPIKNNLSSTINNETIANGQDSVSSVVQEDSKEKDSSTAVISKVDLLQTAPEKPTENILFGKKKVVPTKKTNGLYAELSFTPYKAFYKNDPLVSVKRITVTPMRKSEFTATDIRSSTQAAFAYTIALRKNVNKRLALGTGLQYSFIKENVRLSGVETSTSFNIVKRLNANNGNPFLFDDTVSTSSSGKRTIHATNSYSLVSIPLLFHYELMTSKNWAFSFVGGTYLNVSTRYGNSISGEFVPVYSNGETGGKSDNKFTVDIFAGLRFSRRMGSKYLLFAEPGFRYSLMKYDMQQVVNNKYIHRAGISFGVTWKPGK